MTLKDYEKNIIETEENILEDVLTTIRDSNKNFSERLENEQKRATELTKELVNAKNDQCAVYAQIDIQAARYYKTLCPIANID